MYHFKWLCFTQIVLIKSFFALHGQFLGFFSLPIIIARHKSELETAFINCTWKMTATLVDPSFKPSGQPSHVFFLVHGFVAIVAGDTRQSGNDDELSDLVVLHNWLQYCLITT